MYWSQESSGQYSVRSVYRLLQAQKNQWRQDDDGSFWRKIWRIKAPPKVLNFVWRALSFCLPTMVMLQQKHVPVLKECPVCGSEDESIQHALVYCTTAAQCWQRILPEVSLQEGEDLYGWWKIVLERCNKDKQAEVATISWTIWKARNDRVWNNKQAQVNGVLSSAKSYLEQWRIAQRSSSKDLFPNHVDGDGAVAWVKPQEANIKITVDAAIFTEYNFSGMGLVARDKRGELVKARTVGVQGTYPAEVVEAIAIKEALSWIKDERWEHVEVESDSLGTVQAIRSKVPMLSPFGQLVEGCRRSLKELNKVSLFYIRRSANMAAHELSRASYSFPDRVFDGSSVPVKVKNVLMSELVS